jgi:hypothetical protein
MRFALLFLHFTFGSLNASAASSALRCAAASSGEKKTACVAFFNYFKVSLDSVVVNTIFFEDKTLLVFLIDTNSSHFFQDARGSMVVGKSSQFRSNKLGQNSALGSYPCKKLLFLGHGGIAAQVMRWPGCDFYPGLLRASFTSWCTAVQHRATPCAFVR